MSVLFLIKVIDLLHNVPQEMPNKPLEYMVYNCLLHAFAFKKRWILKVYIVSL